MNRCVTPIEWQACTGGATAVGQLALAPPGRRAMRGDGEEHATNWLVKDRWIIGLSYQSNMLRYET